MPQYRSSLGNASGHFLIRTLLNTCPYRFEKIQGVDSEAHDSPNMVLYKDLNWNARKLILQVFLHVKSHISEATVNSALTKTNDRDGYSKFTSEYFIGIILMICRRFENTDSIVVSSKIPRIIIGYL